MNERNDDEDREDNNMTIDFTIDASLPKSAIDDLRKSAREAVVRVLAAVDQRKEQPFDHRSHDRHRSHEKFYLAAPSESDRPGKK